MKRYPGKTVRRPGFTIVEILVVLAIIGILVAITATAASQVILRQKVSVTETTVLKVSRMVDAQWQAVFDDAMKDNSPLYTFYLNGDPTNATPALRFQGLLAMAGGDSNRARLIWAKLRLRQEFPMNITEATSVIRDNSAPIPFIRLPAKPAYVSYFTTGLPLSPQRQEWALCLYLALNSVRGGRDAHLDQSLSTNELLDRGDGRPEIVDGWGNGLALYRWPALNAEVDALCPQGPNARNRDPHDPRGLLLDGAWWTSPTGGRWAFEQLCHLVSPAPPAANQYPVGEKLQVSRARAYYMVPVVASAGRYLPDPGQPSGVHPTLGIWQPGQIYGPNVPDMMDYAPVAPPLYAIFDARRSFDDNIYSYRLRLGARGD
jgi:prepilin-type N-terminal cleavage/methylation domain-containing protein